MQHDFVETFANAICRRLPGFGPGAFAVIDAKAANRTNLKLLATIEPGECG